MPESASMARAFIRGPVVIGSPVMLCQKMQHGAFGWGAWMRLNGHSKIVFRASSASNSPGMSAILFCIGLMAAPRINWLWS